MKKLNEEIVKLRFENQSLHRKHILSETARKEALEATIRLNGELMETVHLRSQFQQLQKSSFQLEKQFQQLQQTHHHFVEDTQRQSIKFTTMQETNEELKKINQEIQQENCQFKDTIEGPFHSTMNSHVRQTY
jgi:chromosome condensin MukBEF ATPase and DNA-binding subunit MukB